MPAHDEHPFRDFLAALVNAFALGRTVTDDGWPRRWHLWRGRTKK